MLCQATFVAGSYANEAFSVSYPYYNESGTSYHFSPENWLSDNTGFNVPRYNRGQEVINKPRSTNPWSLPVPRWAPTMPQYPGSAFKKNDYAQTPQYLMQTNEHAGASSSASSSDSHFYERSNSELSSPSSSAGSNWQQFPGFQSATPRFVTPDTLDKLNGHTRQVPHSSALNSYTNRLKNNFQKDSSCCHNERDRQKAQNANRGYSPQTNRAYPYSTDWSMPLTMDAAQLNRERLLYMGDSLPSVPDAAISGLPPMNIFEPLPPVLSGSSNDIDWGTNRFGIGPYGDFLQY